MVGFMWGETKHESSQFLDSKTNGEKTLKLGCIVSKKSARKSFYRISMISEFTVGLENPERCILGEGTQGWEGRVQDSVWGGGGWRL